MVRVTCIRSFPGQNHWKGGSRSDKVKNPGPHCGFSSESKICDIQSLVSQWPLRSGVNHRWITNHPTIGAHALFATLGQLRPTSFLNFLIFGHFHARLFSIFFLCLHLSMLCDSSKSQGNLDKLYFVIWITRCNTLHRQMKMFILGIWKCKVYPNVYPNVNEG